MNTSLPLSHPPQAQEPTLPASRLAYAGLIPFVLGAALVWLVHPEVRPDVTLALAGYGAAIVAFLGGVHWGLAMQAEAPGPRSWGWAVVPPLASSVAILMPAYAGLVVLGVMLVVCYLVDRRLYVQKGLSHWLTLRFRLSVVAAFCCFLAAAGI